MTETMGGLNGRVFLTIRNNNGDDNPWSVEIIAALKKIGCTTIIVESLVEGEMAVDDETVVVPLFDHKHGVNWFKPVIKSAKVVPNWAWEMSSTLCIAVGERCVSSAADAARQIARGFIGDVEFPFKQSLQSQTRPASSRPGWRAPSIQWHKPRLRR